MSISEPLKPSIINAISSFDIELLSKILDDNFKYQNLEKKQFIAKMKDLFDRFRLSGDTDLEPYKGRCNECNILDNGFSFIGNVSKSFIDLIIRYDKNMVIDIFECSNFKNDTFGTKKGREYLDDKPF